MHVALVTDAGYLPWCATAVRSCLDAHPGRPLHVHVVHDGTVAGGEAERLRSMAAATAPATVEVHAVDPERVAHLPAVGRFGPVVWLRFLLPELLVDVDRVIYLDADTLVLDDLTPLAELDLEGAPLAAVANVVPPEHGSRLAALGVAADGVFNSGVLVMDLARMRTEDLTAQVADVVSAFGDRITWPDQDALAILYAGRWRPLHPRFNAQNSVFSWPDRAGATFGAAAVAEAVADPAVVHFEGPSVCKPWHALSLHPHRDRYREVLARTPWAATPLDDDVDVVRLLARLPPSWQLPTYRRLVGVRSANRAHVRSNLAEARRRARAAARAGTGRDRRPAELPPDPTRVPPHPLSTASAAHRRTVQRCLPYTMGSVERLLATIDATEYVVARALPGALVECGVWRGGSALAMVLTLQRAGVDDRDVVLFDTFTGMTEPTVADTSAFHPPAADGWAKATREGRLPYDDLFAGSTFGADQVRRLLHATGYPPERIHLVAGPVEETLPDAAPAAVALLRLDTDWYESTRHELAHLYPALVEGGVLIVDDYGHWDGARKAVDELLAGESRLLLSRSDYTGRMAVKH